MDDKDPSPPKKLRRFIIDGITHQAFELIEGKFFLEFRDTPPRLPIYVVEEVPEIKVAINPHDTGKE